jgi:hypothetical protein
MVKTLLFFSFALNIGLLWWLMVVRYRVKLLRSALGNIISMAVQSRHDLLLERGLLVFLRSQEKNLEKIK